MAYPKSYNPCDDCPYSFSKNNQESNMCKICEFKQLLDKPTVDVVEVVRCENCTHKVDYCGRIMCDKNARRINDGIVGLTATSPEHFCSYGERKDS